MASLKSSYLFRNLEGDLFLKNGRLTGLSNLARSMPTLLKYEDGVVKVSTSLGVTNLESPFDTSTSVEVTEKFQPEVAALVDKIGFECGVEIPIKSGSSLDGRYNKTTLQCRYFYSTYFFHCP